MKHSALKVEAIKDAASHLEALKVIRNLADTENLQDKDCLESFENLYFRVLKSAPAFIHLSETYKESCDISAEIDAKIEEAMKALGIPGYALDRFFS